MPAVKKGQIRAKNVYHSLYRKKKVPTFAKNAQLVTALMIKVEPGATSVQLVKQAARVLDV